MRNRFVVTGLVMLMMFGSVNLSISWAQGDDGCPPDYAGYLMPRLQVGQRGIVVPGGTRNRVRALPSTSGEQVGTLQPGAQFDVIGGAVCDAASGLIWWQVSGDGIEGWTAEGLPPDEYFLEPIAAPAPTATPTLSRTPSFTSTPTFTPTAFVIPSLDFPDLDTLAPLAVDNVLTMAILAELPPLSRTRAAFLSPDMNFLFVVTSQQSGGNYANVYTFPDLEPVTQGVLLAGTSGSRNSVNPYALFTPNGDLMAGQASSFGNPLFYRPGEVEFRVDVVPLSNVGAFALSADGIAAAGMSVSSSTPGNDGEYQLCLYDGTEAGRYGAEGRLCVVQEQSVRKLVFLPDGERLLAGTVDGLTVYDVRTGGVLETFNYGMEHEGTIAVLPGDQDLPIVLISREGYVLSVDLATGAERTYVSGEGRVVRDILLPPDGSQMMFIVRTLTNPDVLVVDTQTRAILHRDTIFDRVSAGYSPDGRLAFVNNTLFDPSTWQPIREMRDNEAIIGFSPDGKLLLVQHTSTRAIQFWGVQG